MTTQFDGLPNLKETITQHNLRAKKSFGQNFLLDFNILHKIVKCAGQLENEHILEVGPGPGGLTRAILAQNPASVTVIEKDATCLPVLEKIRTRYPGIIKIIIGDALKMQDDIKSTSSLKIIANLPYNIATALLVHWLSVQSWPPFYKSMTLMFQREVAERITAQPGTKNYGRLSVLANWRCHTHRIYDIPPQAFFPQPKVTSSVVHLVPREKPLHCELNHLTKMVAIAFEQRRKMLRQSLKKYCEPTVFEKADVDDTLRPEQLSVEQFVRLTNADQALKSG